MKRFITGERKLRYPYFELFDAGNIADDGSLLDPESPRGHTNRVRGFHMNYGAGPLTSSWPIH